MRLPNAVRNIATVTTLLRGAEAHARAAGDDLPGAEHLLLSALDLDDGSARRAFERIGADPDRFGDAIALQHAGGLRTIGVEVPTEVLPEPADAAGIAAPTGVYRCAPSGQVAFQEAVELQKTSRSRRLLGAHVVAAVARMEHGTAARALWAMGVDRDSLASAARSEFTLPSG